MMMTRRLFVPMIAAMTLLAPAMPAQAAGDLLVAPTRVVLDGSRATEVVLNNIGSAPATYRISLEVKRMTGQGGLEEIAEADANAAERAALDMISFSPRRVTLPPNQPQVIRVGVRLPEGIAPGEYRVHMLFRAIPDTVAATAPASGNAGGVNIALTPIYGITIPIIVRVGDLSASASIGKALIVEEDGQPHFAFDLARTGNRSVYGDIEVTRPGVKDPLFLARGIAVYSEVTDRRVSIPVPPAVAATLKGPVRIRYTEDRELGGGTIAETSLTVE
jgi:hypothetical protein